ncbi:Lysophospholipase L1 [Granulicella rosea]|uniref:Lysophospholipase L1 n=2 Tax=Granulicella rosea TaxID=474952 RepID=A0A239ECA5_9BACT|nr:Lysophospholipase L1 [Granulicella rosea]
MKLPFQIMLSALLLPPFTLHGQQANTTPMRPMEPIPSNVTYAPANSSLPTIFIVGDSTSVGWGPQFAPFFETRKVNVVVAGASGRSSRTYMTEGLWDRVRAHIHAHDVVLIQFGHNDSSGLNDPFRARGTMKGIGDETEEIDNQLTKKHEVVHSYGWYLRRYVQDTKAKGAVPVILSLTPDNVWNGDKMAPSNVRFAGWAADVAEQEHVNYVNINAILNDRYSKLGKEKTRELFATNDKIHLTKVGWQLNALWILEALERLGDTPVDRFLSVRGKEALPVSPK